MKIEKIMIDKIKYSFGRNLRIKPIMTDFYRLHIIDQQFLIIDYFVKI